MKMKLDLAKIVPFDNRSPDKNQLYPFPFPDGIRAVIITNGSTGKTEMYHEDGSLLTDFVPHIIDTATKLYDAMMSEPQTGITVLGQQKYFPGIAFDVILHDRAGRGSAEKTLAAYDDYLFEGYPVSSKDTAAVVLATVPIAAFNRGKDDVDIWLRRAHLKRGLTSIGMGNIYANPHPIMYPLAIAPLDWARPEMGVAGSTARPFWKQVDNCMVDGYKGCLVVDVYQPYGSNNGAFQLINEDNYL